MSPVAHIYGGRTLSSRRPFGIIRPCLDRSTGHRQMIDFSISHETRLIVETVRRFVESELQPLEDEVETKGALDPDQACEIIQKSKALGLYGLNMPREVGGGGLSTVETCLVEEQAGRTIDILIRRALGNVYEMLLACKGGQRERWLLPTVRGERHCSIAMTEPEAGSDAAGIRTRAVQDGNGWRLSGQKHFISDGAFADFFVVSAVTDPDAGHRGISLFLVDKGQPGFTGDVTLEFADLFGVTTKLDVYRRARRGGNVAAYVGAKAASGAAVITGILAAVLGIVVVYVSVSAG